MSSPTLKPEKENLQLKSNRNRDSNLSYDKNNKILLNKKRKPDNINKSNVSKSYSEEKKKQMKKKENKKENKKNFTENKPKKSYRKRNKKDDSISSENEYEKEKINSNKKSEHIYEILYSSEEENNQNDKKIYLNKELKSKNYSENKILLMTKDSSRSSSQKKDNIIKEKISENNNLKSTSQDINDKRIFIGNIDYKCQEKELQEYFKNCGRITDVKIEKTYDGKSRGHGYIDFENKNSIEIALKKDGKLFQGRKLVIKKYIDKGTNSMIFLEEKFKNLESSNKKLEGELKGTQNELKETQNELKGTKNELKGTQNKLKGTQNELKEAQNEIKKNKNEIRQINIKFGLLNEINEQSDIYYNKNINILNSKVNALLNSYKILYIRKMSHFILNEIITKYKKNLALSETEFKERGFPYHLIVAQDNIKGISKFQINSIFDYLRYISYFTSKIIHLNKKNIKIQKEIFYEILGKTNKKNDKIIVTIDDMTNIIFGNRDELDNIDKRSKFTEINNNLIQIINKYIREEEKKEKEDNEEEQGVEDNEEEQEKEDNEEEQGEEDNEEEQEKSDEEEQKKGNEEEQGEEDNEEEQEEEDEEKQKKEEEIKRRQNTSKKKEINISEYYNDENECKKIKNIISGEKIYNVKIKNLLQKLSKIIEMNINLKSNNITKYKNIEINSEYFYKLWLESFKFRDKNYKKFIKTEYLNSAAEMGKIVKIILNNNIKKGLFDYDSGKFEQRIKKTILKY